MYAGAKVVVDRSKGNPEDPETPTEAGNDPPDSEPDQDDEIDPCSNLQE